MIHASATSLYMSMWDAVQGWQYRRQSGDAASPQRAITLEAEPGSSFKLAVSTPNVVGCRQVDLRWARANLLHFFSDTEEADVLRRYNRHADRFLTGTQWIGAYGRIAMRQIRSCIGILRESRHSRRAVVSMGEALPADINRPACWSMLHFLVTGDALWTLCYQRSLSLAVMPYDCILLTNIAMHVAGAVCVEPGVLVWQLGSLHAPEECEPGSVGIERSVFVEDGDDPERYYAQLLEEADAE